MISAIRRSLLHPAQCWGMAVGLLVCVPGCGAFRAQVGVGYGVGATVKVPALLHMSLGGGRYKHIGPDYLGLEKGGWDEVTGYVVGHTESRAERFDSVNSEKHSCLAILPTLTEFDDYRWPLYDGWALEAGFQMFFVDLRLGFNPALIGVPKREVDAEE